MRPSRELSERAVKIAQVLRPLGRQPMRRDQAERAAQLLGVHWTTVYRLRRRFLRDPVASSLLAKAPGRPKGSRRLDPRVEEIIEETLQGWMPRQRELAHPLLDVSMEIRRRCRRAGVNPPSRNSVARRWGVLKDLQAQLLAEDPESQDAPGNFGATAPLDIVQIDHTQADVFVVDRWFRRALGRPWLSVAIDLATRCVVGIYVGMERPSAGTVALLVSRIALPKDAWLQKLGVEVSWPMHGLPKTLHLDNAAEFRGRALRMGCAEYGIELMFRPVGRPQFGGHIERMNRTLMQRLRGLPGATGNAAKGRKERKPEAKAALTLEEFERWLAIEVAQRYHNSEHRGLHGATPASAWEVLAQNSPPRQLQPGPDEALRLLMHFMPVAERSVQADGLALFCIRYWHPVFAAWFERKRHVVVRYHPEDLSRIFVTVDGKRYVEARYADLRRPAITLWEQRAAVRILREQGQRRLSEGLIFEAIEQQRQIVARARKATEAAKRRTPLPKRMSSTPWETPPKQVQDAVDYSSPVEAFPVELW